jgi:isopentenyl diphosphate isomerase/L-lactate dehydrogenase-like FMN-dependent dehydrogenase
MPQGLPPTYVAYEDFLERARKVLPPPIFTYLQAGIGEEDGLRRNRDDLRNVILVPKITGDMNPPDTSVSFAGRNWTYPFAIAPVGTPGIFCPGVEKALAAASHGIGIPYALSTVASATIEDVAPVAKDNFWFQLYPIRNEEARGDIIARAAKTGCELMMVTVDIPTGQRREKAMRTGVQPPVRLAPLFRMAPFYPRWALRMLKGPNPEVMNIKPYMKAAKNMGDMSQPLGPREIADIRKVWRGKLLVKGVLDARAAAEMMEAGADGVVVSNHGGRQLDAAPSPVRVLPAIRQAVGKDALVLADSGAVCGLDVLRLLRLGADMVMLGKYPYTAVGALGLGAARPALDIICDQISTVMVQLGMRRVSEIMDLDFEAPILTSG